MATKNSKAIKRPVNRRFTGARGSVAHVHMEIITSKGNRATVTGNPAMPETTMRAVAEMIDVLSEAIVTGKIKCH